MRRHDVTAETREAGFLKKAVLVLAFVAGLTLSIWIMTRGGVWAFVGGLGTVAVSFAYAIGVNRVFRREPIRPPTRRYLLRFGISMSAYVVLLLGGVWLYNHGLTSGPLGYVVALAPAAAILCCIASMG